jgi:hypothetical protein
MAQREAGYLASDIFGSLNRSLPLAEWVSLSRSAGLHFLGTFHAFFAIRALLNGDLHALVMPRARADVALLADAMQPMSFHHMVLSGKAPGKTPWNDARKLLRRRPGLTSIYKFSTPRGGGPWHNLRNLKLESQSTNTKVELRVPQWEVRILEESDGERSLGEILRPVTPAVSAQSLREAMYMLYLLGVINLLP